MVRTPRWFLSTLLLVCGFALGVFLLTPRTPRLPSGPAPPPRPTAPPGDGGSAPAPATQQPPSRSRPGTAHTAPRFVDVTVAAGITFRHENGHTGKYKYLEIMGAGVGVFDYDGDGLLDIYFVNGNHIDAPHSTTITNHLYRNNGDWTFTDVTDKAGVAGIGYGQGCCTGDFDKDGDEDLYVSNFGPNILYGNQGDGAFRDVAPTAGVADPGWGQSCSFLDFDGDGQLDLYVQNYLEWDPAEVVEAYIYVAGRKVLDYPSPLGYRGSPDRLFRNRADGTFQEVTKEAGLSQPTGKGMGVACADLNDDGHIDIFVANDTMENFLFFNRGDGTFQEAGLLAGVAYNRMGIPEASMGVDVADCDGDGRLDLIVPCYRNQFFTLYRNKGGRFEDDPGTSGLAEATGRATGFSANFLDYDNDGDLDLFFTAGGVRANEDAPPDASYQRRYGMPDLLLANDGHGRFVDVSAGAGPYFQEARIGRGAATGDLDNDGDLDIVISNLADRAVVLRNETPCVHWITLELIAAGGSHNPVGADVWLEAGGSRRRSYVHGGVTYLSQNDRRVHFGLGETTQVDRVEIRWPSGTRQLLRNLAVDRIVQVQEPAPAP